MRNLNLMTICLTVYIMAMSSAYATEDPYITTRTLSADSANRIAVAAQHACRKKGYQVAVAVTDRYGNLLAFVRDPLAGVNTIKVAQQKAFTAATFRIQTLDFGERFPFMRDRPNLILIGGGVPIQVGGHMYGSVGVSGSPQANKPGGNDDACAREGIKALQETLEFSN